MVDLNPTAAATDGTSATLVVPTYANGAFALQMLGTSGQPVLQVVPVLNAYTVEGRNVLQVLGRGLEEGNNTSYQLAGSTVVDTAVNGGPDVFQYYDNGNSSGLYTDNGGVNITEPVHGLGSVTVTTAGGTSAQLTVNELEPGLGYLRDVAFNPANPTQLWVADNGNPAAFRLIDLTTGQQIRSIATTKVSNATNSVGNTTFFGGLQVLPSAMTLNGISVPAGSLLAFYGPSNP